VKWDPEGGEAKGRGLEIKISCFRVELPRTSDNPPSASLLCISICYSL
jgi:hypothetical protein